MDWNSLKTFLAIAESGSLQGAAKRLGVNHSTVFRRLNGLEKELGGRLFERLPHAYVLTATGEEALQIAQRMQEQALDLERRVLGKDVQLKGLVKITAPNNIAYRYLPGYLAEFKKLYPEIQLELLVSNQALNMNERQADIAVRATDAPPQHLVGRLLREIPWAVYAGEGYVKRHGMPSDLQDLQDHRLIGGRGGMRDLDAFQWLEKHHDDETHIKCDDLVAMSYFAQADQGLAFLPDDQRRPGIKRLFTFPPGGVSKLWLLTHPDLRHTERVKKVMQFLAQAFINDPVLTA